MTQYFRRFLTVISLFALGVTFLALCKQPKQNEGTIVLKVGVFQDERLPSLSQSDLNEIFSEAKRMLNVKFGPLPLEFEITSEGSLQSFFKEVEQASPEFTQWQQSHPPLFALPQSQWFNLLKKAEPKIERFLKKQWSLKQLSTYYKAASYSAFTQELSRVYLQKLQKLSSYHLQDKTPLFSGDARLHSYAHWLQVMKWQKHYDVIMTNTILVYDVIEEPYPHVVYKHAKVSGSSFESPQRNGYLAGSSSMSTVFELYTKEPYFMGEKTAKIWGMSRKEINLALGGYLVAHELGHQIYWIPDVYDHPAGCLMDTKMENQEIGDGYRQLLQFTHVCPKCLPYVQARHRIMQAHKMLNKNHDKKAALSVIEKELTDYPRPVDRDLTEVRNFYEHLSP